MIRASVQYPQRGGNLARNRRNKPKKHPAYIGATVALLRFSQIGILARNQRNKKLPTVVLLTASAPTRIKDGLAVIWVNKVAVVEDFSALIHLKARDRVLGVACGDELFARWG